MKVLNKSLTVFFILFGALNAFAQPGPPDGPETPPSPIDGVGLLILGFAAISFGIYVIYKHKLKTKASV
ncbi:hypothetical protein [Flavobacterium sp. RS13.1]|jgi:drug/metabolite transporter (DMT)-like permease|uniref:hypothetical protein n=1 Tax=Flavobacterium sp. RS13.1 TaxID=3400345 RepID=UPI003AB0FA20